ncbi:MAG: sulfite exporter TauE/SafE family protein [Armatimonadota bacterium]|nr:MAG: sulfite exporter TauE/SafE family protein [Armatimonadota bacterium]
MAYFLVCTAALLVSALTFFSGFGLGALLMPVFALFFPVEVAVAATAMVHMANNFFKLALVGRYAVWRVWALFALPGAALAFVGAFVLTKIADIAPFASYELGGKSHEISLVKIVIASLIAFFSVFQLHPYFGRIPFERKWLPVGGAVSGFFGGLSGHQGALRAAFLAKMRFDAQSYIGTSVACSTTVDIARMTVYGIALSAGHFGELGEGKATGLVIAGIAAAFTGAFLGSRYMKKMTMGAVRVLVGVMLMALAIAIGSGLV